MTEEQIIDRVLLEISFNVGEELLNKMVEEAVLQEVSSSIETRKKVDELSARLRKVTIARYMTHRNIESKGDQN